jgi:hypothetical protein
MVAVVSHDAGGAEIVSSYVRQRRADAVFVLDGPARAVFARKLGAVRQVALEAAVAQCDSLICGTSWQSNLEIDAIRAAKSLRKPSVAFLDHWANYKERFVRDGEMWLPDEIWVGDTIARSMAISAFPGLPVRLVGNPYFADIKRELDALQTQRAHALGGTSVLYVAEPLREQAQLQFGDERHWGYVEEEALRYFLRNISCLGAVTDVVIRPHPSEALDKYAWAQSEFDLPIVMGGSRPLLEEIVGADVVVGCESMALVVGLLAGKRVVSCIPPGGRPCVLPHREIVRLETLLDMSEQPR